MTTGNPLRDKSYAFALAIMKLCKVLRDKREYDLAKQLFKSGTSIGANIEEAFRAFTKKDFVAKLSISHKESGESDFWLRLIVDSNLIAKEAQDLRKDLDEIIRMLCATIKKLHFRTDIE